MAATSWDTEGPAAYLRTHREEVVDALSTHDLAPEIHHGDARELSMLDDDSVDLVVTSPPYPYIEMWDDQFARQLGLDSDAFEQGLAAFDATHKLLAEVWEACHRVLKEGGILCVNIGDATRTIRGEFRCLPNHARVLEHCLALGFEPLIPILWKKPTTKPNSFLGSGFLPTNGYVTLDCEHILVLRKNGKRVFPPKDPLRYASAFSKSERDTWFSQIWEVNGRPQEGLAAFPEEIPYRLIRMFSVLGDTILDPFAGSGSTLRVARSLGRKAVGVELERRILPTLRGNVPKDALAPSDLVDRLIEFYEADQSQIETLRSTPLQGVIDGV